MVTISQSEAVNRGYCCVFAYSLCGAWHVRGPHHYMKADGVDLETRHNLRELFVAHVAVELMGRPELIEALDADFVAANAGRWKSANARITRVLAAAARG